MSWIERGPYFKSDKWIVLCRCGWDFWSEAFVSTLRAISRHVYFTHKSEWVPFPISELEEHREVYNFLSEVARYIE